MVPIVDIGVHVGVQRLVLVGGGVVGRRHAEDGVMFLGQRIRVVVVEITPFSWHHVMLRQIWWSWNREEVVENFDNEISL